MLLLSPVLLSILLEYVQSEGVVECSRVSPGSFRSIQKGNIKCPENVHVCMKFVPYFKREI